MEIRKGTIEEFESILSFYYQLIDSFDELEYRPAWQKDIYPSASFIMHALESGNLSVAIIDGQVVGSVICDHFGNVEYSNVKWAVDAKDSEVMVLHALGVSKEHMRHGIGKALVREVIRIARESGCKAVRLDVLDGNLAAAKLYESVGFEPVCKMNLYYRTGWHDFVLYEYVL
ncbi:MAG: GNAT family N-acetyltransferase [Coriobacteriales bacterium]|nr:GNAT family N-acetyltransferase [Coriobacteriales bacterium]